MKYIHLAAYESDFTIELAKPIETGQWEIGLAEFSFHNNFQPALEPYGGLLWRFKDSRGHNNFYYYPTGDYYDKRSLITRINSDQEKVWINWVEGSASMMMVRPNSDGSRSKFNRNRKIGRAHV